MSEADDTTRIVAVLLAYATAIDTKNWGLFERQFDPDCTMTSPGTTTLGATRLTEHMRTLHEPLNASLHRITNVVIDIDGDQADATSYLDALLVRSAATDGPTFRVAGTYADHLTRSTHGWVIQRREFHAVWREGNPAVLSRA